MSENNRRILDEAVRLLSEENSSNTGPDLTWTVGTYVRYYEFKLAQTRANPRVFSEDERNQVEFSYLLFRRAYEQILAPARPPSSAILSSVLPTRMSEDVIANLNETYESIWLPRHGTKTARRIWKAQAAGIILRQWLSPFLSIVDRVRGLTTGR